MSQNCQLHSGLESATKTTMTTAGELDSQSSMLPNFLIQSGTCKASELHVLHTVIMAKDKEVIRNTSYIRMEKEL